MLTRCCQTWRAFFRGVRPVVLSTFLGTVAAPLRRAMPHAYGYVRVSHDRQAASGLGLAAQQRGIEGRYQERLRPLGIAWGGVVGDPAVSAGRKRLLDRPGGRRLDQLLTRGDHVIVAKLDRAFRSLRDFAEVLDRWQRRGVYVHLLDLDVDTSGPIGELIAGIMACVAQWESRRIGERIQEAMAELRAMGRASNGRATIGYRLRRGKLVPDERERAAIRRIIRLRRRGLIWREIAARLNAQGLRTREGRRWSHQACWRAYQRALELGLRRK